MKRKKWLYFLLFTYTEFTESTYTNNTKLSSMNLEGECLRTYQESSNSNNNNNNRKK